MVSLEDVRVSVTYHHEQPVVESTKPHVQRALAQTCYWSWEL